MRSSAWASHWLIPRAAEVQNAVPEATQERVPERQEVQPVQSVIPAQSSAAASQRNVVPQQVMPQPIQGQEESAQNKKAANEGGQEAAGEVSNTDSNKTDKGGEVVVTGNEFGEYKDIKELRKKAVQYYADHLQGTSVENVVLGKIDIDENGLVNFTGAGKREMKSTSAKAYKLLLVKHLPSLINRATDITSSEAVKERHANETFYYLHTDAIVDGKKMPVDITLVKRNDGSIQYYNHVLPSEETKDTSVSPGPESSNEALGTPAVDVSLVTPSITQEQEKSKVETDSLKERFESAAKSRDAGKAAAVLTGYIDERGKRKVEVKTAFKK